MKVQRVCPALLPTIIDLAGITLLGWLELTGTLLAVLAERHVLFLTSTLRICTLRPVTTTPGAGAGMSKNAPRL